MDFEWDPIKSQRNEAERGLPFELAVLLFDGPVIEGVDGRQAYGEVRIRAIGGVGEAIPHCVYTCARRGVPNHQLALCQQKGARCLSCGEPEPRLTRQN
jgi:hypothetical protein